MNLLLLERDDLKPGDDGSVRVRLEGRRLAHLLRARTPAPGDELRIGIVGGALGSARVLSVGDAGIELLVLALDRDPPPRLPLTLVLALPRPKMLSRLLAAVASAGVERVYVVNAFRVDKSYWSTPLLGSAEIERQLGLGLEQARDTIVPRVELRPRFKPFVEDELPWLAGGATALVAHPAAPTRCPHAPPAPVTLAVGPEGGFTDYEIDKLTNAGLTAASLGPRVLRVETVVPLLIGRLFG